MSRLTIPECREELTVIANTVEQVMPYSARAIRNIIEHMKRRPAVRRARAKSQPMTQELREKLANYAENCPDMTYQEIAEYFGVSAGRVSEALAGFRQ